MAGLSDLIETFLLDTFGENDKMMISRNSLASHFSCAPSQINYVLSTRFNHDKGYLVESKRGGSGYITLIKISGEKSEYLNNLISEVGFESLSITRCNGILQKMTRDEIISHREARIIGTAVSDKNFVDTNINKDTRRSIIFRNILLELLKEE